MAPEVNLVHTGTQVWLQTGSLIMTGVFIIDVVSDNKNDIQLTQELVKIPAAVPSFINSSSNGMVY